MKGPMSENGTRKPCRENSSRDLPFPETERGKNKRSEVGGQHRNPSQLGTVQPSYVLLLLRIISPWSEEGAMMV